MSMGPSVRPHDVQCDLSDTMEAPFGNLSATTARKLPTDAPMKNAVTPSTHSITTQPGPRC